ncbi:senecionine N-oxygenase-like isoform X2 [Argopecten irradians]|uniref:senecionine N-oxygenase-like isoform X2 n=1 Tax=Argopecten irradians TaxID=31199 RepID=UPI00370FC217
MRQFYTEKQMSEKVKRVAVIGAGISGLATLRNLLSSDRKYIPTCFDRGSDVGGVWLYNENTHTDEYGMPVFSNMYRDLITNLPTPLMEVPGFPNTDPDRDSSYMHRDQVLDYIKRFTAHYDLRKYVITHTYVTDITRNSAERIPEWTVSYRDIRNQDCKREVFDAVIVCTGHQHTPYVPDIDGVEIFQGDVIHSKNYRVPEKFTNKKVVILGASYSGIDIAIGIAPCAKQQMSEQVKRVAVIGAGISGLATLRNLLSSDRKYIPTCFDRGSDVGGVWLYNENTHTDETNLPTPLMEVPGFPNTDPERDSSYMHRDQVLDYIKRFTAHYDLRKYVMTHTYVTDITRNSAERIPEWTVSYRDIRNQDCKREVFDAVIVCTGHQHTPYVPDIDGVEIFQGDVIHSKNYRVPEKFTNKKVVILGASYSGIDIAIGIAPCAKQIFLSHNKDKLNSVLPANIIEKPGIKRMSMDSVVFLDDTEEEVDDLIFCTGYVYSFPFLSDDVIHASRTKVTPLYKHVVNVRHPNLFFIGILEAVAYFIMAHVLSKVAVVVLDDLGSLPSEMEMQACVDRDFEMRKERGDKPHIFTKIERLWEFEKDLASYAGIQPSPKVFELIRAYNIDQFRKPCHYVSSEKNTGFRRQNVVQSLKLIMNGI